MARIITVTSGKGGVGKTSISLNLSLALASQGFKVCLFDADLGLANVNILTGIYPKKDLGHVISGQFNLNEVIIRDYQGIDIIPGSSGIQKIADLTRTETGTLISAFLDLDEYDYFIFDTSAGISSQVLSFCMASHEIVLVATCEPTSLTDAYSMLKVLSRYGYDSPIRVIINQVTSGKAAKKAYAHLKTTVNRFLDVRIVPLGIVASDKNVQAAVISQTPFWMLFPDTVASKCIKNICEKLVFNAVSSGDMQLELFWDKCLRFLEKHRRPEDFLEKDPAQPSGDKTAEDLQIKTALSQMESKLSLLMEEVKQIKMMLQHPKNISPETPSPPPEPREISIDFEAWMEKKYK
ncbi:MAG: AAA family ATPase [Proteobacteria bacterium]|nr:AAA family ATPase [Pseudomonadota bacterium]MBU1386747.1 AAA family ATPase [Pseudomonadota bacterium]MBU1544691.1 AAA family ATPase [Pseudomonadota bacterium]MBU2480548.1 AAA family ATPase [Pseudomonadota bacterium]